MTNIWDPSSNHLGRFRTGWNEAQEGESPTQKDTWHNLGRYCQVRFGNFANGPDATEELQEKLFLLIVNQRRWETRADRQGKNIPQTDLLGVPKGSRSSKK